MLMNLSRFLVLLVLLGSTSLLHAQKIGIRLVPDSSLKEAGNHLLTAFAYKLNQAIREGAVKVYKERSLKVYYSANELYWLLYDPEPQKILDEPAMRGKDTLILKDTLAHTWVKPENWEHLELIGDSVLGLIAHQRELYFSIKDPTFLSEFPELDLIRESLNRWAVPIRGSLFDSAFTSFANHVQYKIAWLASLDSLPIYSTPLGDHPLERPSFRQKPGSLYSYHIVQNYLNPTDPYDLLDTVVAEPLQEENFSGFYFCNVLEGQVTHSVSLWGVSLSVIPSRAKSLDNRWDTRRKQSKDPESITWIKYTDLEKKLRPEESQLLVFLNSYFLINAVSDHNAEW